MKANILHKGVVMLEDLWVKAHLLSTPLKNQEFIKELFLQVAKLVKQFLLFIS